jgi:hypothetical protein
MQLEEERIIFQYPRRAKKLDGTYYHVSTRDYQEEQSVWSPWVPLDSGINELEIPRICVSPTISQCLLAINYKAFYYDRLIIYKTNAKVYYPVGVNDQKITEEMWILSPIKFIYCGEISMKQFTFNWTKFQKILKDSYVLGWTAHGPKEDVLKKYASIIKVYLEKNKIYNQP